MRSDTALAVPPATYRTNTAFWGMPATRRFTSLEAQEPRSTSFAGRHGGHPPPCLPVSGCATWQSAAWGGGTEAAGANYVP